MISFPKRVVIAKSIGVIKKKKRGQTTQARKTQIKESRKGGKRRRKGGSKRIPEHCESTILVHGLYQAEDTPRAAGKSLNVAARKGNSERKGGVSREKTSLVPVR